jgi:hypothetical protein
MARRYWQEVRRAKLDWNLVRGIIADGLALARMDVHRLDAMALLGWVNEFGNERA